MPQSSHDTLGPEGSYFEAKERAEEKKLRKKLDAMYPLIITTLFLVLGVAFDLWHPGWLLFMTIPLHYMRPRTRLQQLTNPVMITLIYMVLGIFFDLWHPGWLIFLAIPFSAIAGNYK
ncbi:MAG: hypothetical protein GX096_06350 [Clostridiales bacterium]|nr:hypothetical protein [Clostridiales bacterium]